MNEQLLQERTVIQDLVKIDGRGRAHRQDGKFMSNHHVEMIDAYQEEIRAFDPAYQDLKNGAVIPSDLSPAHAEGVAMKAAARNEDWVTKREANRTGKLIGLNADRRRQLVAASFTGELHADDVAYLDKLIAAEKAELDIPAWVNEGAAMSQTSQPVGLMQRIKWSAQNLKDKALGGLDSLAERLVARKRGMAIAAGALALFGAVAANHEGSSMPFEQVASAQEGSSSSSTSTTKKATTTTAAPTTTTTLSQADLQARYGGESTGEHGVHDIGFFNIDPNNPNQSLENLYAELRVNSDAQAFWNACLATGTPGYDACVADATVLANANKMATEYQSMTLEQKATTAESIIAKFKKAEFNGITIENGRYQTVAIGSDGKFKASANTRNDDPVMNFTFEGDDGEMYEVDIRSCVQVVKRQNPAPTPTPKEETPPTTVPKTTTTVPKTTTTVPKTTTTVPKTTTTVPKTTTTVPKTTTTTQPTTTTTKPTTTTTQPTTTTTEQKNPVPLPTTPEFPDQEPGDPGENPNVPDSGNTGQDEDGHLPGQNPTTVPATSPEQAPDAPTNPEDDPSDGTVPLELIMIPGLFGAVKLRRRLQVSSAPNGRDPLDFNFDEEL